ncbi:hypothetical protein HMPREF0791_0341 [Staphylococcus epidermidis W23144]|nr:hypothetical protein HMPREF0791_0341 [Staphylococcus epidermidis W23144]EHM73868.1 hypothetical protein HMPREF9956_1663 [Staphylococcus epidermidis 14.1.R1.SE]EHR81578.1 hypothetical protein SEVCU118_0432 [Staphylococcus epidermidis VCU118]EHR98411.1 hypothetical protein SEVCU128_2303 [Staphylococcus epidermidis VCU128]
MKFSSPLSFSINYFINEYLKQLKMENKLSIGNVRTYQQNVSKLWVSSEVVCGYVNK